jgi:sterol desaturase/sphingolipid hydroxylase (fatty acid hydroxylase superfamily)
MYFLIPLVNIGVAVWVAENDWGILNQFEPAFLVAVIAGVLALDFLNYVQHWLLHHVPVLWRVHRSHHTDPGCDVTTSFRFHPLEIFIGFTFEMSTIVIFGIDPIVVAGYRLVRVSISTFVHGNVKLPRTLDQVLRYFIVTPDVHRLHHSIEKSESISNFSGGLIWWDILFNTYQAQPGLGHEGMQIGVIGYDDKRAGSLWKIISDPFLRKPGAE